MRPIAAVLGGLLVLIAIGCAKTSGTSGVGEAGKASGTGTVENTSWTLTHVGADKVVGVDKEREPFLTFKDGQVSGNAGCNRLAGGYTLDGASLTFTPLALTRMACTSGMEIEAKFTAALAKVAAFKVAGSQLDLLDAAGETVTRLRQGQ